MTDTITRNSTPTAPIANLLFVEQYDASHQVENILHPQLNGSGFNVTYRAARKRSGTLALVFPTAAAASAAVALLVTPHTFTLAADVPQVNMTFVLRPGELRPRQGSPGSAVWILDVPFQEV